MPKFTFYAVGDGRITARHRTTMEITKDRVRTGKGDCIVACGASFGLAGLPEALKIALKRTGARAKLRIEAGGVSDEVKGFGDPRLSFESDSEMVVRKSSFVCGRTLFINADKSASDLREDLKDALAREGEVIRITIEVEEASSKSRTSGSTSWKAEG